MKQAVKMRLQRLRAHLAKQLTESSTWRGLVLIATGLLGWNVESVRAEAIITLGIMIAGFIAVIFPDKVRMPAEPEEKPDDASK
jgi:hypothetical protein